MSIDIGALILCASVTGVLYAAAFRPLVMRRENAAQAVELIVEEEDRTSWLEGQCRPITHHLDQFQIRYPDTVVQFEYGSQLNARLDALMQLVQKCSLSIDGVHPGEITPAGIST